MNALATWFLVMSAVSPLGGAYSALGPMPIEQCRAGEKAIASESIHCRQASSWLVCPTGDSSRTQLCPVFDELKLGDVQ
jgi:hypothetical protein